MGYGLSELFQALNERSLTFRRTSAGELEVIGDINRLDDAIRLAVSDHRQTILACLPQAAAAAVPPAVRAANDIRQQLDEFGLWLRQYAAWAKPDYLDSIDTRLAEAVDTQKPHAVAQQIQALMSQVEAINWASEILPRSYEVEAKHATEAGAGPAADSVKPNGISF